MLCYMDMTFCDSERCQNKECTRSCKNINKEHLIKVGLPLAISDFSQGCSVYWDKDDTEEYIKEIKERYYK